VSENDFLMAGGNPLSQRGKLAGKGVALNMAGALKPHGGAAVAIPPGVFRPGGGLGGVCGPGSEWGAGGGKEKDFWEVGSALFVGRAVAALAQDGRILQRSGQLYGSWELGREYGFTDADGRRPDWGAIAIDFSQLPPALLEYMRTGAHIQVEWLEAVSQR